MSDAGTCLGFLTAALFATGAEPAQLAKPEIAGSIPDDTAALVWQAAESLYTLSSGSGTSRWVTSSSSYHRAGSASRCWPSRSDLGGRWPSRLAATAAEKRVNIPARNAGAD